MIALFLALLTLVPCFALADTVDYCNLSTEELWTVIADARAALARLDRASEGSYIICPSSERCFYMGYSV